VHPLPLRLLALILGVSLLAGCAHWKGEDPPRRSLDGLSQVKSYTRGNLYVRPDHQIGRYDDLMVHRIGFSYAANQRSLSESEEERIRNLLVGVIEKGSEDGTVGITSSPGRCVLKVDLYLVDLELKETEYTGSHSSFVSSYGSATMVLELRDSMSDDPLARYVERRGLGGGGSIGNTGTQIHRLGRTIGSAMADMGRQLEKVIPPTAGTWDHSCKGGMARLALGAGR